MPKDKSEKEKRKARKSEVQDPGQGQESPMKVAEDVEMADGSLTSPEKKEKKSKKDKSEIIIPVEDLSPIAHPLAQKKLVKKLHKTIKKASKRRQVKRGVKEIVKGIRKGDKGLLVLAADISPIDIISHLPVLSEDASIPYIFVTSKEELGHASSTKRPTSCVMICPSMKRKSKVVEGQVEDKEEDYQELYDECMQEVQALDEKILI
ncbi:50S ribosomal protein L30e-like protein [Gautieria morchelliformis]|nr:50S ribosomal protein L30e-like protein [Gautieria morchelliformis]